LGSIVGNGKLRLHEVHVEFVFLRDNDNMVHSVNPTRLLHVHCIPGYVCTTVYLLWLHVRIAGDCVEHGMGIGDGPFDHGMPCGLVPIQHLTL
jgi:hypothetical protein